MAEPEGRKKSECNMDHCDREVADPSARLRHGQRGLFKPQEWIAPEGHVRVEKAVSGGGVFFPPRRPCVTAPLVQVVAAIAGQALGRTRERVDCQGVVRMLSSTCK